MGAARVRGGNFDESSVGVEPTRISYVRMTYEFLIDSKYLIVGEHQLSAVRGWCRPAPPAARCTR